MNKLNKITASLMAVSAGLLLAACAPMSADNMKKEEMAKQQMEKKEMMDKKAMMEKEDMMKKDAMAKPAAKL